MSRLGYAVAVVVVAGLAGTLGWLTQSDKEPGLLPAPAPELRGQVLGQARRDGVDITLEVVSSGTAAVLTEGVFADFRIHLRDAGSGQPLVGLTPGAWIDQQVLHGSGPDDPAMACRQRIAHYLKGTLGVRPVVDLNSYYMLVLNQDPSISVIDPSVSLGGLTSTLARIVLKRSPMDWVESRRQKRLYVSMPSADEVAVIDTESFNVLASVPAGAQPVRVALQPDERYLWVGNNASDPALSGVTVLDTVTLEPVLQLATGAGHHEIAFTSDSSRAFVSNRDAGTVSVFDTATLKQLTELKPGGQLLALAYAELAGALYVVDGASGRISVFDARSLKPRAEILSQPGLGPLQISPDGRHALVLNPREDRVLVLDTASDRLIHELQVSGEPYQLTFSKTYAYVRTLGSNRVSMIALGSLGPGSTPIFQDFEAGVPAPGLAGNLPLASGMGLAVDDNAVFVVNPVDNSIYFYMEGMNAPSSAYINRGHTSRAVRVVDRTLQEVEPGVYQGRVRVPSAGELDLAMVLAQPDMTQCFSFQVAADPELALRRMSPRVEYLLENGVVRGEPSQPVRLRLWRGDSQEPWSGVEDLRLRYFLAPASRSREQPVRELGDGLYEATLSLEQPGAYYLHLASESLGLTWGDLPYASVRKLLNGD